MAKVLINIPDDLIPEGYEVDRFGYPKNGEFILGTHGTLGVVAGPWLGDLCLILRRKWEWPKWLLCDSIEWSNDKGYWFAWKNGITWPVPFSILDCPPPPDKIQVYKRPGL